MTKKKGEKRKLVPGDDGYKSATQLRNERKRRALKKGGPDAIDGAATSPADPSLQYLSNPVKAPIVRRAVQFFREQAVDFPVVIGPTRGWRTVSKLAVRSTGTDKKLSIGLFQPKTHRLIPGSGSTPVHHTSINKAVQQIQSIARSCSVAPYDETTGQGDLRNVAINVERSTGKVQVTIIWKGNSGDKDQHRKAHEFASQLVANMKKLLHSLWIHFNSSWKHDNAIISHTGSWEHVYGAEHVVEYLGLAEEGERPSTLPDSRSLPRVPLHFPPFVFRQANIDAFGKIVGKIREALSQETKELKHCVELYGGVGTIGLSIADLFEAFVSSDENPHNKACFDRSVECMDTASMQSKGSISYESASAESMVAKGCLDQADFVIVDPPRKGLDRSVVDGLCNHHRPRHLVYVSCGFDAFVRDHQALVQTGRWKLVQAEGHILFPGSDAIETLAFFRRSAS